MKNKKNIIIGILVAVVFVGLLVFLYIQYKSYGATENNSTDDYNFKIESRIVDIDWSSYEIQDVKLSKSLTITNEGVYRLSGTIKNGHILINTKGKVKLIFDNVSITNSIGPAIMVDNAKKFEIELVDGSKNTLVDGKEYNGTTADACIYSKDDLIISGNGTLNITGNHTAGIHTKKDLKIYSGDINIKAVANGISGKDSVEIVDGNIKIESGKNGIKSSNDKEQDRGFVLIRGGKIDINSKHDAIQAETILFVEAGDISIKTYGDPNAYENGKKISAKGLKAEKILLEDGDFKINASDDAIHSNDYVYIKDANTSIKTKDDAIHADKKVVIDSGIMDIEESYEGIEANEIVINDGELKINSSDDGINGANSEDSSKDDFRKGPEKGKGGNSSLTINGGSIIVKALGDGLDINGTITINDGILIVEGPEDNSNSAIDYDSDFIINGGEVIAIGYKGLQKGSSEDSKQVGILINMDNIYEGKLEIKDKDKKAIISYTPSKKYNSIFVTSSKFSKNSEYKLYIADKEVETIKVDKINLTIGEVGFGGPGGKPGKPGDKRPNKR